LDITVPLKTLVIDKCKLQGSIPDYSRPKVGRPKKVYATIDGDRKRTSNMVTESHGNDAMKNQMAIVGVESQGQQSNNDAMSGQLVIVTAEGNAQACLQASNQSRKRGRPRKDGSLSANSQPKKRGRPPKNRDASGNSQSAENTPDSLANSTLQRNAMTVRAEKLKRENLRVQGTPSGTQKF